MIVTVIGPMFSSKTTTLFMYEKKFFILKKKICMIKHSIDNRYSTDDKIINHDGYQSMHSHVYITSHLSSLFDKLETYDCILIDEGQFFPDLNDLCIKFGKTKHIVIAGLLSDFKKEAFQSISAILPISDKIIHLSALCTICGEKAPFTSRLVSGDSQTLIGSSESYEPRCGMCHTVPNK